MQSIAQKENRRTAATRRRGWGTSLTRCRKLARVCSRLVTAALAAAVGAGSLALVGATALPQTASSNPQTSQVAKTVQLTVPYISQENFLPTGCETVSALMLLHYWGIPVNAEGFLKHLKQEPVQEQDGLLVGPDPNEAFAGDPREPNAFGCYPPVIVEALKPLLPALLSVHDTTGTPLDQLAKTCLPAGEPVLVWATINMQEPVQDVTWTVRDTGKKFTWLGREHCLVLRGYDETGYWFNDPYDSNGIVHWDKQTAELRYQQMGSRSVAVVKGRKSPV